VKIYGATGSALSAKQHGTFIERLSLGILSGSCYASACQAMDGFIPFLQALPSLIHFAEQYPHTSVSDAHSLPTIASSPKCATHPSWQVATQSPAGNACRHILSATGEMKYCSCRGYGKVQKQAPLSQLPARPTQSETLKNVISSS
jgi:hypothetical protein